MQNSTIKVSNWKEFHHPSDSEDYNLIGDTSEEEAEGLPEIPTIRRRKDASPAPAPPPAPEPEPRAAPTSVQEELNYVKEQLKQAQEAIEKLSRGESLGPIPPPPAPAPPTATPSKEKPFAGITINKGYLVWPSMQAQSF